MAEMYKYDKNIVIFDGKKLQVKMLIYQTAKMRTDNKQCT